MGASITKVILYRVDHDVQLTEFDKHRAIFFTNLSGAICNIKSTKHEDDKSIKIIEYIVDSDTDLYNLVMKSNMMTVFPKIDYNFIDTHFKFCKKLLKADKADKNMFKEPVSDEIVTEIHREFGDIFLIDISDENVNKHFKINKIYDFNIPVFDDMIPDNPNNIQDPSKKEKSLDLSKRLKSQKTGDGLIEHMLELGIIKVSDEKPNEDGKRKKKRKSRSRRKKSSKKISKRTKKSSK